MAGKVVETVSLKLDLQGFAKLQGLGNTFKKLENPIALAGRGVERLRREIIGYGNATPKTIHQMNAQVDALTRIRQSTVVGSQGFKQLTADINKLNNALNKANASMNRASFGRKDMMQGLGIVGGATAFGGPLPGATGLIGGGISKAMGQGFASGATAGVGVGFASKPVVDAIGATANYAAEYQKLQITLRGIVKDQESYNIALNAAREATERFNIPQEVAIRGITRMSAAVLGAGGNVHNAAQSFLDVTAAIKGSAGSAEDVKAAITALVQIYSKGKVSAEELSGQLGERFPGAVTKFAEANKDVFKSTADLQKGLKDGTVGLDMLEKFLRSLGGEFGELADKIGASAQEAGARLTIEVNKMKLAIGTQLQPIGAEFQEIFVQLITDLIPTIKSLAEVMIGFLKPLVATVRALVPLIKNLAEAVGTAGLAFAFNVAAKGVINLGALLVGGAAAKGFKFGLLRAIVLIRKQIILLTATMAKNPLFAIGIGVAITIQQINKKMTEFANLLEEINAGSPEAIEKGKKQLLELQKQLKTGTKELKGNLVGGLSVSLSDKEIKKIKTKISDLKKSLKAAGIGFDPEKGIFFDSLIGDKKDGEKDKSPFASFTEELEDFDNALEQVAVNGFKKLEDTLVKFAETGKLAFKDLVRSIISDLTRLSIRQTITRPLFNAFTNLFSPVSLPTTKGIGPVADLATYASDISGFNAGLAAMNDIEAGRRNALGNAFAKNGVVPYYKGGVVNRPTMFQYGGSNLGIMGEAGPEAILPLQRGRGGRLGVAMQGGGGGTTNVNYTGPTLNFNGDEFVPKSAVGDIISAAAARGESRTISSLKNSRGRRASLGL